MKYTRNEFLKFTAGTATVAAAGGFIFPGQDKEENLNLGLTSYTLRNFSLDDTIKMSQRLGLTSISLKAMHMPLEAEAGEIKKIAGKVRAAGLNLYGAGVIYMKTAKEAESTFSYATTAGLEMIVGVPNHELLPLVNELVKKHNIKLAIHNHGPGDDLYRSPSDVYEKIKNLDKRIGLCIDIGHVKRIGQDPVTMLQRYKDRLYDMHMKDVDKDTADGGSIEIGRGLIDIPAIIRTLKKIKYQWQVAFEFEKDEKDPLAGLAESVGYVRGIMKVV